MLPSSNAKRQEISPINDGSDNDDDDEIKQLLSNNDNK